MFFLLSKCNLGRTFFYRWTPPSQVESIFCLKKSPFQIQLRKEREKNFSKAFREVEIKMNISFMSDFVKYEPTH